MYILYYSYSQDNFRKFVYSGAAQFQLTVSDSSIRDYLDEKIYTGTIVTLSTFKARMRDKLRVQANLRHQVNMAQNNSATYEEILHYKNGHGN